MIPFGYFDLIEMFPQTGCAICNLIVRDVDRLVDGLLWEHTNDPYILEKIRASRGLCNEHGWQFLEIAYALNVAVFYEPVLDEVLRILADPPLESKPQDVVRRFFARNNGNPLADALDPVQPCMVCALQNESEARFVDIVAQYVTDARFAEAFRASDGLCLEHFKMALRQTAHPDKLVCIQKDIWTHLHADLKTLMLKLAVHVSNDDIGEEADSWRRTHAVFTGSKGVFGRRR